MSPDRKKQIQQKIAELEKMKADPKLKQQDLLFRLANNPITQGILGAGDTFKNQTNALANLATGGLIPYKPTKSGEGTAYDVGKIGFEVAEMLAPGTMIGRLLASQGQGALGNPENPQQGANEGLLWGLVGEGAGQAIKGAGSLFRNKIIEPLSLDKQSAEVSARIKEMFETAKDSAWGSVKPIFEKYNGEEVFKRGPYGEITEGNGSLEVEELFTKNKDLFTGDAKKLKKEFDKKPTIENTQNLVEKLGVDSRKISYSQDPTKELKAQTYNDARDYLRQMLTTKMDSVNPGFSDLYKQANKEYAQKVSPFYSGKSLESAAAGNVEHLSDINTDIVEGSKNQMRGYADIGKEHDLQGLNKEIESSLGISQMFPQGASKLAPVFGTPLSREKAYSVSTKAYEWANPYLRALLQSQNAPGVNE